MNSSHFRAFQCNLVCENQSTSSRDTSWIKFVTPIITLLIKLTTSPVLIKLYRILFIIIWNVAGIIFHYNHVHSNLQIILFSYLYSLTSSNIDYISLFSLRYSSRPLLTPWISISDIQELLVNQSNLLNSLHSR